MTMVEIAKRNNVSKSRYNPHVFTEQGLYMLMTVLKGPLSVKQGKVLIRTFSCVILHETWFFGHGEWSSYSNLQL